MAEIIPQQILVPKKVYIGDSAELRCTFTIQSAALKEKVSSGTVEIPVENFISQPDVNDCIIKKVQLLPSGIDYYQAVITFVPWKTGDLQLPPLLLEDVQLFIQPVQIVSIIEQSNASVIKEPMAPLLLPGTTYKLYGAVIAFIILIVVAIQLIVRRKAVAFFIKTKKLQRKYKKNKKQTIKLLRNLKDEKEAAGEMQKIVRNYLEVRFDYPFTKCVTSELMNKFLETTQNLLGDEKNEAFDEIAGIFIRTDFIRYSSAGKFDAGEKTLLVEKLIMNIETLEGGVEKNA